jgi:glycosyltransferase involved in cell wall biosynthesis
MKIVFFTFYYPPDLCAGSFRAVALVRALSKRLKDNDELHVITTHPNRYKSYRVKAENIEVDGKITIHRITVPEHDSDILLQIRTFSVYAVSAYRMCKRLNPNFLIGTTGRLMTGVLTGVSAYRLNCPYFIDLRDIFSETISDIFSRKSKILGSFFRLLFSVFEKRLLDNAAGVNVVSEGFPEYFQTKGVDVSSWSFFPNGIDKEFMNLSLVRKDFSQGVKTILYAGNIGSGQGLEILLPDVAKCMGSEYHFLIIGGGGGCPKLINTIKKENINNIEILPPIKREDLIAYYQNADILFLHLNNIPAFKRVLPSKIFEYAALGKPIVAGLSGYSAQFMVENVPNSIIFSPGDVDGCVDALKKAEKLDIKNENGNIFIKKYSREKIMDRMVGHIFSVFAIPDFGVATFKRVKGNEKIAKL